MVGFRVNGSSSYNKERLILLSEVCCERYGGKPAGHSATLFLNPFSTPGLSQVGWHHKDTT